MNKHEGANERTKANVVHVVMAQSKQKRSQSHQPTLPCQLRAEILTPAMEHESGQEHNDDHHEDDHDEGPAQGDDHEEPQDDYQEVPPSSDEN